MMLTNDGPTFKRKVLRVFAADVLDYFRSVTGAGGFFAPSLAAGAAMGSWLGEAVHTPFPHLFILLGMIGFLTGVTRVPFTSFVLVLEMTDHESAILPMMASALAAYLVARMVERKSFYEKVKETYFPATAPKNTKTRILQETK